MKKLLYILTIGVLLCSCSAQQRLTRLLIQHPELQYIDTVTVHDSVIVRDTFIINADTAQVSISLQEILNMDYAAADTAAVASASTQHATAQLQAVGDGQFILQAITVSDTVIIEDTVYVDVEIEVPTYYTDTQYVEKEVYKMHWYQTVFCWIGCIALILALILITIRIALTWSQKIL